uniref:LamG-like jellyroll fold domain-containing protein n=1 Tax=viral metagenome TaxID=1070528 RepID=A0A6C0JZ26_9ZZZZ
MDITQIMLAVATAIAVLLAFYLYFTYYGSGTSGSVVLQGSTQDGKKEQTSTQNIPRSKDEQQGLTFSYTCWIRIDDFSYRFGVPKVVFVKGTPDLKAACPALLVDGNTNSLLVKLDTFGAQETISVPNIPAKKWLFVGIAVNQESVDVYINGTLFTHHSISQVPKQNSSPVHTGVSGGFDGKISNLQYYTSFLDASGIQSVMSSTPKPDPADTGAALPPYFDITWWSGRK